MKAEFVPYNRVSKSGCKDRGGIVPKPKLLFVLHWFIPSYMVVTN